MVEFIKRLWGDFMNETAYKKISAWFLCHKIPLRILMFCGEILPLIVAAGYFILLGVEFFSYGIFDKRFLKALLIPAFVFLFVSALRSLLNSKRPYEIYNIKPIVKKETCGKSFPSRHTASVFIITMAFLSTNSWIGIICLIFGVLIGLSRIFYGVHFIRDVVSAVFLSITVGIIFFV